MAIKKKTSKKQSKGFRKYIFWFWGLFLTGVLGVVLVFLLASWGAFGKMPDLRQLEDPDTNQASEIVSSDGKTLGKFYLRENRTPIKFEDLPANLVNALIATEDERFYEHSGIDGRGTLRAFAFLGSKGGASTITQQLARQLFVGVRSNNKFDAITQKIKEWVIAVRLERNYTKEEIVTMYFNTYDFGNLAVGIRSASRIYFGKEPKDLTMEESAMLVGMFQNSSLYNPRRNVEGVTNRRNIVLFQMYKNEFITKEVKDSLQAIPVTLNYNPESHNYGIATYFRGYLQQYMKDWIKNNPKEDGEKYDLYLDGLKIYTTIDSRMQTYAEEAVRDHMIDLQNEFDVQNTPERNKTTPFLKLTKDEVTHTLNVAMVRSERWRHMMYDLGKSKEEIKASFHKEKEMTVFSWDGEIDTIMTPYDSIRYYKKFLRTGMMSMEPQTGHVKAWVGGINYKHFKFDMVKQGTRQVGSTFKPFVYASAVDQLHYAPCYEVPDVQHCIPANKYGNLKAWCPDNSNNEFSGEMMSLSAALANSVNSVTATLMDQIGPGPVVDLAHRMGITSEIPEYPSIALGTPDVTVYEMVGAYGTFANKGVYVEPVVVTRIEDKNGAVLYEYKPNTRDVLSPDVAYTMLEMMKGVVKHGSGGRLRHTTMGYRQDYKEVMTGYPYGFTNPIAGKTGTTQNQSDGWFMGIVPNLVTGVWVGGENRSIHFRSITYGQGAAMALPIWGLYMKKCYANEELGVSKEDFEKPEEMNIDLTCGGRVPDETVPEGDTPPEEMPKDDGFDTDF
ncbi:penicillin-binding protein 1A [Neptunitalea lumnitzerae]|uniref:Penicillin-binding protein 1A n=1 Tax=Neptunitalea lumnitzerae TaxID=2965509 RepID=A0ABQ5MFB4_9FLAO|nr:transglycosylase domain-containing protein [Neptunitalea sp. Y10]GLB48084.1 penicillin-binding protein 1A [Neptunitalea sp. Y10]